MIVPVERNKHIIMLCKWHHREDNTVIAIRKFISKWCALEYEQVSDSTIYDFLLSTMEELFDKKYFVQFIKHIFSRRDNVNYMDVIQQMIGEIAGTKVIEENGEVLIDLEFEESICG